MNELQREKEKLEMLVDLCQQWRRQKLNINAAANVNQQHLSLSAALGMQDDAHREHLRQVHLAEHAELLH